MKHQRFGMILIIIVGACLHSTVSAQEKEPVPADTASTSDLFNPPRVITPEHTSYRKGGQPERDAPSGAELHGTEVSEQSGKRKCWSCSQNGGPGAGGGGEFVTGFAFLNLEEINKQVGTMGISPLSQDVFLVGGKGYGRIGYLIIGGAGYAGRTESSGIPDCCARFAEFEIAYGGLILGATYPQARYELAGGMLFGGGSVTVTRTRNSREIAGWEEAWDPYRKDGADSVAAEDLNITSEITGDFIALEPFVAFKYWVLQFMAFDFSASYLRAVIDMGSWELDGVRIPDSPETNVGGLTLKLGIHFGV
jgi:hypothetical protein